MARAARRPGDRGGHWLAQSSELGLWGKAEGKELRSSWAAEASKTQQLSG